MSQESPDSTAVGEPRSIERMAWAYAEMRQIEVHWTQQGPEPVGRITTTLTVNGIILALLAGSGILTGKSARPVAGLLVASLSLLALGLVIGPVSLLPLIGVGGSPSGTLKDEQKRTRED